MPEQEAPKKTVVAGRLRTVFITAQPEGPHFCGGFVLPWLVVVPAPAVVLLLELPPHAAIRSAIAVIAPSAAPRHEIEDISKGSFSLGIKSRSLRDIRPSILHLSASDGPQKLSHTSPLVSIASR
jgi:hypothetical protein